MSLAVGFVILALVVAAAAWFAWHSRGADSNQAAPPEKRLEDVARVETQADVEMPARAATPSAELAPAPERAAEPPVRSAPPAASPSPAPAVPLAPAVPPAPVAPYAPEAPSATPAPTPPAASPAQSRAEPAPPATADTGLQERILPIVRVDATHWSAAIAFDSAPDRLAAITALLAPALRAGQGTDGEAILAISFEGDDAIGIARADTATLDALSRRGASTAAAASGATAAPAGWLGREGAAAVAGSVLADWARSRYVDGLDARLPEIKSALGAALPKLDGETQRRLRKLVHEFSRFVREARDNYAGAIRKPVFLERVAEAGAEAARVWAAVQDRMKAIRVQLDSLASAPRYGEVQLERTIGQLRALHEERRIEALGARLVAALAVLRLGLGDAAAEGEHSLDALCAAHRADLDAEQALRSRLAECERSAKGPAYAGKGEFESNRVASRTWHSKLEAEPADGAGHHLAAARAAVAAGFLGGDATDWTLLLRRDRDGGVVEVRRARLLAAQPGSTLAAGADRSV